MLITANFGTANTGASVYYTLLSPDKSVAQSRRTTGITELQSSSGMYGVQVADATLAGLTVLWDINGTAKVATETFPADLPALVADVAAVHVHAATIEGFGAPPSVSAVAAGILTTPANKLLTSASGYVTSTNAGSGASAADVRAEMDSNSTKLASAVAQTTSDAILAAVDASGGHNATIKAKTDQLAFSTANQVDAKTLNNSDKTGYALSTAGNTSIAAAVWDRATSALTTAGSAGKRFMDFVTTLVYAAPPSVAALATSGQVAAVQAKTDQLAFTSGRVDANAPVDTSGLATSGFVNTELQRTEALIATRLPTSGYTAPPSVAGLATSGQVATVQAKTDQLAFTSGRVDANATVSTAGLATSGQAAAIQAKTDQLAFSTANQVDAKTLNNADKTGYALSTAGNSGVQLAVWNALTSAQTTAGSIGKRLVDFVTTLVYAAPPAAAPSTADVAAAILSTPSNKLVTNTSGQVQTSNAGTPDLSAVTGAIEDIVDGTTPVARVMLVDTTTNLTHGGTGGGGETPVGYVRISDATLGTLLPGTVIDAYLVFDTDYSDPVTDPVTAAANGTWHMDLPENATYRIVARLRKHATVTQEVTV